jgi:hypothetical protein
MEVQLDVECGERPVAALPRQPAQQRAPRLRGADAGAGTKFSFTVAQDRVRLEWFVPAEAGHEFSVERAVWKME